LSQIHLLSRRPLVLVVVMTIALTTLSAHLDLAAKSRAGVTSDVNKFPDVYLK
jgi:uncharacterized protein YoxC